ncbi:Uma2 family endonuclease [Aetokthonos hydrillicola Thurmond2011]|jgi:Uma2 family endonuclease|uniref:Uma2 family endonuclease n=1 Tax=Aetokthonos hydrillicola Thurmond2011 TaxID=2712845 RepID=A0AAP5IBF2_9CYAN|nr:Uma2 family endonuclease [Aetokthonos hydrillicola]MBO3461487.1 Uma2 family endonuclease [Aetokthonos hydrillicola CCALA 1050]MBW4584874.1 Uma2 family endonuclease [Aetokthonos hydrillicola CCALA 1050]MDR9898094.1 Uma2 family endonuclease [Aetokthonos hydrillicola Thurmond2011]
MIAQPQPQLMTPQQYLEWEEQQPIKYEYINGEVFAMTGGNLPHNSIAINLTSALKNHIRGKGCKVFMADAKVGVSLQGPFHYPDVMVSCNPEDQRARQVIYHPCLIVEVLSPSTEAFDRGKKFRHYRRIDSLKEYILIETDKMNVECYRRNEKGKWEVTYYSIEETTQDGTELEVQLTSVDFRCPISLLYEDVVFPENNPQEIADN